MAKPKQTRTRLDLGQLYRYVKHHGEATVRQISESTLFACDRRTIQYWMRHMERLELVQTRKVPSARKPCKSYSLAEGVTERDFVAARKSRRHKSEIWNRLETMTDAEFEALVWKWADERLAEEIDDGRIRSGNDTAGADSGLGTGIW